VIADDDDEGGGDDGLPPQDVEALRAALVDMLRAMRTWPTSTIGWRR